MKNNQKTLEEVSNTNGDRSKKENNNDSEDKGEPNPEGNQFSQKEIVTSLDKTSVRKIPQDWEAKRLEDITKDTLYGASKSAEDFDPNKPRYIRVTDLYEDRNELKDKEPKSITRDKVEKYILEKGDMLFARSGSVGKTFYYDGSSDDYAYGGYLIKFPVVKEEINPYYLQSYTNSPSYWKWVKRITRTGAQPNINAREFSSLLLPVPSKSEQKKIASVLYNIDKGIQKIEEIIEQTQRVKKALMQDLFTEGYYEHEEFENIRSGPIKIKKPQKWGLKTIPDIFKIIDGDRGKNYPGSSELHDEGKCLFLNAGNVTSKGLRFDETEFITEEKDGKMRKGKLKRKDLIMTTRGTVGNIGFYSSDIDYDHMRINSGMVILRSKEKCDHNFFYHFFNSEIFQNQIKNLKYGTAQPQLSVTLIRKLKILIPDLEEQRKIANILDDLSEVIQKYRQQKKEYKSLKKGLIQDLLTGEVRTKDKDIEVLDEVKAGKSGGS